MCPHVTMCSLEPFRGLCAVSNYSLILRSNDVNGIQRLLFTETSRERQKHELTVSERNAVKSRFETILLELATSLEYLRKVNDSIRIITEVMNQSVAARLYNFMADHVGGAISPHGSVDILYAIHR